MHNEQQRLCNKAKESTVKDYGQISETSRNIIMNNWKIHRKVIAEQTTQSVKHYSTNKLKSKDKVDVESFN